MLKAWLIFKGTLNRGRDESSLELKELVVVPTTRRLDFDLPALYGLRTLRQERRKMLGEPQIEMS